MALQLPWRITLRLVGCRVIQVVVEATEKRRVIFFDILVVSVDVRKLSPLLRTIIVESKAKRTPALAFH